MLWLSKQNMHPKKSNLYYNVKKNVEEIQINNQLPKGRTGKEAAEQIRR